MQSSRSIKKEKKRKTNKQRKNPYDHHSRCRKGQNQTPLFDKSARNIRDTSDMPRPNKGKLQKAYSSEI